MSSLLIIAAPAAGIPHLYGRATDAGPEWSTCWDLRHFSGFSGDRFMCQVYALKFEASNIVWTQNFACGLCKRHSIRGLTS